ncbi:MAG: HAD family phosphatase [Eubacteriales bacterium]|nr:HAD family phosphatase [Eubacteriales bacterium]
MKLGAIFDMDGLLFDTERLYQENWIVVAKEFGQQPDPGFPKAICGTSGIHALEVVRSYYPAVDAEAFLQSGIDKVTQILQTSVPEKPGVHEILRYLKEHHVRIAVASSSVRTMVQHNLAAAGIASYFDAVVSGQDVVYGKPEPDIFLLAAKRLGIPPHDCYVFEDGINGTHAGIAAGCATVMIPDLTQPSEELRAACVGVYDSLLAAKKALEQGEI